MAAIMAERELREASQTIEETETVVRDTSLDSQSAPVNRRLEAAIIAAVIEDEEVVEVEAAGGSQDSEEPSDLPRITEHIEDDEESAGPTTSSPAQVLSMPSRELVRVICEILEQCSNYSSKKDDLTKRVAKHFGFRTRGEPRKKLTKKIGWALTRLKKDGKVEGHKATNIRIRLLHPTRQDRLF